MTRKEGKKPTKVLWVFCEGKTEKNYFNQLQTVERISRLRIKTRDTGKRTSDGILQDAVKHMQTPEFKAGDIVACVFDTDFNNDRQLAMANSLANKHKILESLSNPCFEYWILCHYEYFQSKCESAEVISKLKKFIRDYKKPCPDLYSKTHDKLNTAKNHARQIMNIHKKEKINLAKKEANPLTFVFQLIEEIEKFRDNN